jgi:predicted 2-oxoglutarate/Fe(II)-dependent dioxygenase YbiX
MAEHCDHIHSLFDGEIKGIPTMSLVGLLNDNYQGGEFVMWQDTVIPLKQGDVMVFPSNFLYPHRVDPVTRGTRHSFVAWAW